jgi:hypothetical protein
MVTSSAAFFPNKTRPLTPPSAHHDIPWVQYLKEALNADARLVKEWNQVLDVLFVFVRCYSSSLHYRFSYVIVLSR